MSRPRTRTFLAILIAAVMLCAAWPATASSHREAPGILEAPQVDATDFYMFRSYEPGREDFVTLIANYNPLQDAYGGPNYFPLDREAIYQINIDNDGDGVEDISFAFFSRPFLKNISLPVGGQQVPIPLLFAGPVGPGDYANQNQVRAYDGYMATGPADALTGSFDATFDGGGVGVQPEDNVGTKTIPDYEAYAAEFMYDIDFAGRPECSGRFFLGQRKESFAVNLGEIFDLVNTNPLGAPNAEENDLADKNITSLVLEVPIDCLTGDSDIIGGWTTAYKPSDRLPSRLYPEAVRFESGLLGDSGPADWVQVSRLGMPLVNEVVIGLPDKDRFNGSRPADDLANFATYVTNPTLPELIEILFPVQAPNNFPRNDLVAAFVTGIEGLNMQGVGEMQRLNTAIPPTPRAMQSNLGVAGGDLAGFPNGRRPGDDVVDASLRVSMGLLCHAFPGAFGCGPADAPDGNLPYTDGVLQTATQFDDAFPYLTTPLPGATSD